MSESLKSPTVFSPKTISEAITTKLKNPDAIFWAGGTFLMSRPSFYPNPKQKDIISLSGISDLSRIHHTDRFIEAGAMVTLNQLLTMGSIILSDDLYNAIHDISSSVIKNQSTIGGALCIKDTRYSLSCILATVNAQAEIKMITKSSPSRWVPISKLYDRKGNFLLSDEVLLTKVRIPTDNSLGSLFISKTLDSPMQSPSSAVCFSLKFSLIQGNMTHPNLCITMPESCFYMSQDFDNLLSTISFPITPDRIQKVSRHLAAELKSSAKQNVSALQIERAVRLLEVTLNEFNIKNLES